MELCFFILAMWMFLTATEKPMRMFGIYPSAAETVVAVPQAVERCRECSVNDQ